MIGQKSNVTDAQLLALEEVCNSFERNWKIGSPEYSIESCLAQLDEAEREFFVGELIAVECELLIKHGQLPDRAQYASRFWQWPDQVRAAFDSCLSDQPPSLPSRPAPPERLGDFRIIREIGRGGMGVVYEAVQESLGRRVAIKTLATDRLYNPENLKRFQREARAVASLHHTNIVEIYGSGEQNGLCYFAMQLIEGKSLNHAIGEWKMDPLRKHSRHEEPALHLSIPSQELTKMSHVLVAKIGLQIARALTFAHGRGILHRDIKPANLLLDAEGIVWVTDFGLAMLTDEQEDITRTGDVVGTLRYLPPEALQGKWDERSDVYGLGLTLYELLTLRPAFIETDRIKLLDQIIRGDHRPPPPRAIDPGMPRDMETIVLKAISQEPRDRYRSVADFAEDLERMLDGRPIQARRASAVERLWKWSHRRPALAALIAVVMLVAAFGIPTLVVLWQSAEAARTTAESERTDAIAARRTADLERKKSEAARDDAEALAYANSTQLAQGFIEQSLGSEARAILKTPLLDNRGARRRDYLEWETSFLCQQLDTSSMTLIGHSGPVFNVAIRPDDAQIATVGGWDPKNATAQGFGEVILWDARTGQKQHVLHDEEAGITGVGFDPSGRRLATISMSGESNGIRGNIIIWDSTTGNRLSCVTAPPRYPRYLIVYESKPILPQVQFSPDGDWLVATSTWIQLRRTDSLETEWQIRGSVATVLPGEDHLLVVDNNFESSVLELATGKLVRSLGHWELPFDFMHTTDRKYLSAMINGGTHVRIWSLPDLSKIRDIATPNIRWGGVSPDGSCVVYGDRNGNLCLRPLNESRPMMTRIGHTSGIHSGAISHDGQWVVTASEDGTARIWRLHESSRPRVLDTSVEFDGLGDIAFADDGRRVVHASSCWSKRSEQTIGSFGINNDHQRQHSIDITKRTHWPRTDIAFSPDGSLLAAPAGETDMEEAVGYAQSEKINIWSSDTFELLQTLDVGSSEITSVAWNRGATQLAVAGYTHGRSAISVFNIDVALESSAVDTDKCAGSRSVSERSLADVTFLVDENRLTAVSFHTGFLAASASTGIHIWSLSEPGVANQSELLHFIPHTGRAAFIEFSPTGDRLAVAYQDERRVRVLDTHSGDVLYDADAPRSVACVRFSPNGRRLAMVGYDSLVYFCDAQSGLRLISLDGSDRQVGTIAFTPRVIFSPDGRRIATNDWQGRITVWEAEPMRLQNRVHP